MLVDSDYFEGTTVLLVVDLMTLETSSTQKDPMAASRDASFSS